MTAEPNSSLLLVAMLLFYVNVFSQPGASGNHQLNSLSSVVAILTLLFLVIPVSGVLKKTYPECVS
jgi:uncharacterized membrane protein